MTKRPNSMRHLDDAIRRECGGGQDAYVRLRTIMANAAVARSLAAGLPVRQDLAEAIEWCDELIRSINASQA